MKALLATVLIVVSFACGYMYREAQVREHNKLQEAVIVEEFIKNTFPKNLKEACQIGGADGRVYKIRRVK